MKVEFSFFPAFVFSGWHSRVHARVRHRGWIHSSQERPGQVPSLSDAAEIRPSAGMMSSRETEKKTFRNVSLVFCSIFSLYLLKSNDTRRGRIGRVDKRLESHPGKMSIYFHLLWTVYRISNNGSPSFPRLLNSSVAKH